MVSTKHLMCFNGLQASVWSLSSLGFLQIYILSLNANANGNDPELQVFYMAKPPVQYSVDVSGDKTE